MPTVDYEEVFEKAEVGIALNDPERGTVGKVNERYAELVGYSRDELRDMEIQEISAEDPSFDQEAAMERIQRALNGDPQQFDWLFERKDGSRFWGEVVLKRTVIGEHDRLLAFVRDVSDRKAYERELEAKNRRLDDFASVVSHDLRNPLAVASGQLELAQEECESERLERVAAKHQRMADLIDDLLALARAGEAVGDTETVSLPDIVEACWRNVETDMAELVVEADGSIQADRQRIQQLLENLMHNSIEHGGAEVTIRVGDLQRGFFLEDDGPGIPPGDRAAVLEPGYTTADEGTGSGLVIVRDIAEAHGWDLTVTESQAGGARIEFTDVDRGE